MNNNTYGGLGIGIWDWGLRGMGTYGGGGVDSRLWSGCAGFFEQGAEWVVEW